MVLLALLSLLAVFGLDLAMGAAFIDPNKGIRSALYHHDLRPDFVGVDDWNGHVYRMATNSLGFKDAAPRTVPLRDPRHRILFLGDSFTEGLGVPFEETFPALLWDRLGRDRTEILNAGVMFYTPKLEALKLAYLVEAVGLLVQEVVLLVDISDPMNELTFADWKPGPLPFSARYWLKRHSYLGHLVLDKVKEPDPVAARLWPDGSDARELYEWTLRPDQVERWAGRGLRLAAGHVDEMVELCRRHAIRLTLTVYPWPYHLSMKDRDSIQLHFWRDYAAAHGIDFVDLWSAFFDRARPGQGNFLAHDVHWSPAGHRLVADLLYEHWQRRDRR
jgi:hypothetical protein